MKPFERFPVCRYCPHCGKMQIASMMVGPLTLVDEDGEDEDVTCCDVCGRWSLIVSAYELKKLPKAEEAKIANSEIGRAIRLAWLMNHAVPRRFT